MFLGIVDAGAKDKIIFRFDLQHGTYPATSLVADAKGNLYGTTFSGGNFCFCGVVFELSPGPGGVWTETVLHAFNGHADGSYPWSGLVFDANGNLFGETLGGGTSNQGTVFELIAGPNNTWRETVIFSLPSADGPNPGKQLTIDSKGNLYGVLSSYNENGAVFKLGRQPNGTWRQTILYAFTGKNGDGVAPLGGVVLDSKGNLYGTTFQGGSLNNGTVFELTPNGNGPWTETILYDFTGKSDGGSPRTPLTIDSAGNLYGTTPAKFGGSMGGTVFRLNQSGGQWIQTVLYTFGTNPSDGSSPSGVVFDARGNLYGTTFAGGIGCNNPGCGTVFILTPQSSGPWKESILHQFESAADGSESASGLLVDNTAARLYGTTQYGGSRLGYGTIFLIEH
jgi:uncharacterized repeat protein (TIGR03803 family)